MHTLCCCVGSVDTVSYRGAIGAACTSSRLVGVMASVPCLVPSS